MKIKQYFKKITPNKILTIKRVVFSTYYLVVNYLYDFKRYIKYSSTNKVDTSEKLIGKIILYYHALEKGMSFKESREGFGQSTATLLVQSVNEYMRCGYDINDVHFRTACSILVKYSKSDILDLKIIESKVNKKGYLNLDESLGGTKTVKKKDVLEAIDIDFVTFFNSRHSIREFSSKPVDQTLIIEALEVVKKYPSVCNRQAARTYLVCSKQKINKHLAFQGGTRGFTNKIDKLIIITMDLSYFSEANERNQAYIDGGIYLMSVLLALHSKGLGALALNWSSDKQQDVKYRSLGLVGESEVIISFVGIGNLTEIITIPKSERSQLKNTLKVIN